MNWETIEVVAIAALVCLITMVSTGLYVDATAKHEAIMHHAAFYESDSWGNTTFRWNDVSFAQTPFK